MVDASSPEWVEQIGEVQQVLEEIGADSIPQLLVFNKLDAVPAERLPAQLSDTYEINHQQVPRLYLSASTGDNLDALRDYMAEAARAKWESARAPAAADDEPDVRFD